MKEPRAAVDRAEDLERTVDRRPPCRPDRRCGGPVRLGERHILTSGADVTFAAGQSVDVFIVYDGHARTEGHVDSILVVNGSADLVDTSANGVVAIVTIVWIPIGLGVLSPRVVRGELSHSLRVGYERRASMRGLRRFEPDRKT